MLWRLCAVALLCQSCVAYRAQNIMTTLDERKIPACVRFEVEIVGDIVGTHGRGFMYIYTATGGAELARCLPILLHIEPRHPQ